MIELLEANRLAKPLTICFSATMPRKDTQRLRIEMIPATLWRRNLRTIMTPTEWHNLRTALITRHGLTCSSCGKVVSERKRLHAHEEWKFLEKAGLPVAWLWRVQLICWHCHMCEHPGVLSALISEGRLTDRAERDVVTHFCEVNGLSEKAWEQCLKSAYTRWHRRSKQSWEIDYGPFTTWARATFRTDPLNKQPWREEEYSVICVEAPAIEDIVANLPISFVNQLPSSAYAKRRWIDEQEALAMEATRRSKAAVKREKAKRRTAEAARKAARSKSRKQLAQL